MPNENTPLIQVVKISPPRQRYTHSTVRRFCTVALSTTLVVVVILFIIPLRWLPESTPHNPRHTPLPHDSWPKGNGLAYDDLQKILLDTPSEEKAREWSQYYTSGPHLAGKNFSQALWTKNKWEEFGIEAAINSYDVYINYPQGHRLTLLKNDKVDYECSLEEDVLEEDSTSGLADRIPTFHGYSASGNVTARYVYVNYGTIQDFDDLVSANVSLKGNIALIKYSHIFRGLKVKRAEELGMVGAVIYSDPMDDGEITEKNGYKPYPDGPARNPSSVQRGSVQFLSASCLSRTPILLIKIGISPGDPTTPGYPSLPGAPRTDPHRTIPRIPSLPISYRDALPLLKALNGHGPPSSDFGKPWTGGLDGVEYNIGPSPSNITLNLVNEQEYVTNPIWNVIGVINGTIPDEVVVVGNHRDACKYNPPKRIHL